MRITASSLLLLFFITACTSTTSVEKGVTTTLSGEMLFSGPNSLQAPVSTTAQGLAKDLEIEASDISSIGVSDIQISLADEQAGIAESLLLQIVSNKNEMVALGTLSPLEDGTSFDLNVAEDINLLPFMKDEGATWVLDVNLSDDIMDEMKATADLTLTINYKN
jgi:hypothetical protein